MHLLEFASRVLSLRDQEVGFLTLLAHLGLAFQQFLHDLLKLLLQGICLPFEQFVAFLGSCNLLLVQLHVPE